MSTTLVKSPQLTEPCAVDGCEAQTLGKLVVTFPGKSANAAILPLLGGKPFRVIVAMCDTHRLIYNNCDSIEDVAVDAISEATGA
jgi:hypothetical protein